MSFLKGLRSVLHVSVIVAALGYFVDIYDLLLFSIVRVPSLRDIGLSESEIATQGLWLLNLQMAGMLIGGILFGIMGDRKGRLKILFGSILLYSVANFANAFVHDVTTYAVLRFIAGIGLAGELGAGITLVSEVLSKELRGYGTMLIASVGVSGAVLAYYVAEHFDWRTAYVVGGVLGFLLLLLRIHVHESGMFKALEAQEQRASVGISRGNFFALFTDKSRFQRLTFCTLIGLPVWYVVGILITLSPEMARALGVQGTVSAGKAVLLCYTGLIFGDFCSGTLSQILQTRKRVISIFVGLTAAAVASYFLLPWRSLKIEVFYGVCFALGFSIGFWAVFVTVAAEHFGTNLRATVATSVPNFARGLLVPMSAIFSLIKSSTDILTAGWMLGLIVIPITFTAIYFLEETYGKDLNFVEK
ncbi:MAG: MFS transporter [Methylacidiphilales bacterium]|nr:MFS transporter [Candidatus Methylacidiphilales bacterium]MDW8349852.1 MFS transporter [Verrucomicrobiae bacterium]